MAWGGSWFWLVVVFSGIGDFSEYHILFLTEISLEDRVVVFIIRDKKLILHDIFLVFCHFYR